MLITQIQLHHLISPPTITVVVRHENSRSITYSSWTRFQELNAGNYEITSEIILKYEFLIQIPNTPKPQRCIVNIGLDSSLPVLMKNDTNLNN